MTEEEKQGKEVYRSRFPRWAGVVAGIVMTASVLQMAFVLASENAGVFSLIGQWLEVHLIAMMLYILGTLVIMFVSMCIWADMLLDGTVFRDDDDQDPPTWISLGGGW